jgi:hypothetical protein
VHPEAQKSVQAVLLEYLDYAITIKESPILGDPVKAQIMLQMAQAINYLAPLAQDDKGQELQLKAEEHQMNLQAKQQELAMKEQEHEMKLQHQQNDHALKLQQAQDNHRNSLVQGQQSHEMKLSQQKQAVKKNDTNK